MLKFEAFNLPQDGLTRICKVGDYEERGLTSTGWTMVGLAESSGAEGDDKNQVLFGVYRLTETEALRVAMASAKLADEAKGKAESKAYELERQLKDTTTRLAQLQERAANGDRTASLLARARERFGKAFVELEHEEP